jgi:hypothetical protein
MNGAEFIGAVKSFLGNLNRLLPQLGPLRLVNVNDHELPMVDASSPSFDTQLAAALPRDWAYPNGEGTRSFSLTSTSLTGFTCSFRKAEDEGSMFPAFDLIIGGSAPKSKSIVNIQLPSDGSAGEATRAFKGAIEYWHPEQGSLRSEKLSEELGQGTGEVRVGFLTYIAGVACGDVGPSVRCEAFDCGVVIQPHAHLWEMGSTKGQIVALREVVEALRSYGLLIPRPTVR